MSKKLMYLALVMLLGLYVGAKANVMIDNFESYWGPDVADTWVADNSTGNSSDATIVPGYNSPQAMQMTATWNNADYAGRNMKKVNDNGSLQPLYTPVPGGKLHMMIKLQEGADWSSLLYMIVWQGGANCDGQGGVADWAQTWILGDAMGWQFWLPPAIIPATIGNSEKSPPVVPGGWFILRITPASGWVDLVIGDNQIVSWSDVSKVSDFAVPVGQIAIQMWGTSGQTFVADIDNVWYEVPEPATIVLLGLGGLAMLRRKYSH